MSDWVEYCNLDVGGWARLRKDGGCGGPHNVRCWSIGNENYLGGKMGAKKPDAWPEPFGGATLSSACLKAFACYHACQTVGPPTCIERNRTLVPAPSGARTNSRMPKG